METRIDEAADGIYRLSTYVPRGPTGITFNQFLIMADQPMLFHCGQRFLFEGMVQAMRKVIWGGSVSVTAKPTKAAR
jgi:flavorubredoxin